MDFPILKLPLFLFLFFILITTTPAISQPCYWCTFLNDDLDSSEILMRKDEIGWGILIPIGVMMARYLKTFNDSESSSWFQLHRACQILAWFTGISGFGIGIYTGNQTPIHGYIGISLFSLATAQILAAIAFRPNRNGRTRMFWNMFHCVVGYGVIGLAIYNMFRGFSISNSYKLWKNIYFGILVCLGCIGVILEVITWFVVCKRKKKEEEEESDENSQHSQVHHHEEFP